MVGKKTGATVQITLWNLSLSGITANQRKRSNCGMVVLPGCSGFKCYFPGFGPTPQTTSFPALFSPRRDWWSERGCAGSVSTSGGPYFCFSDCSLLKLKNMDYPRLISTKCLCFYGINLCYYYICLLKPEDFSNDYGVFCTRLFIRMKTPEGILNSMCLSGTLTFFASRLMDG